MTVGDYEIGQTVPYKYESNIPNMNGYKTYYYAWHDKMDKALTFQTKSVKITISDEKGKSYTLKEGEFTVNTNPGRGGYLSDYRSGYEGNCGQAVPEL